MLQENFDHFYVFSKSSIQFLLCISKAGTGSTPGSISLICLQNTSEKYTKKDNSVSLFTNSFVTHSLSDAYTRDELDFEWLEGSAADQVVVKDRHLAELALTGTEAMKEFEFDTDGGNSGGNDLFTIYVFILIIVDF